MALRPSSAQLSSRGHTGAALWHFFDSLPMGDEISPKTYRRKISITPLSIAISRALCFIFPLWPFIHPSIGGQTHLGNCYYGATALTILIDARAGHQ